jgi:hypothetical protein
MRRRGAILLIGLPDFPVAAAGLSDERGRA